MRSRILCLLVLSLLATVVHVPGAVAAPEERIFHVSHTPPDEAYAELDLPLAVTVQSNCDDFDGFLGSYTCSNVQLTVFYRTVFGVETSRSVSGSDGTEPQQLVVVVPKEHLEIGQFAYYIEVHQTYCVFLGCTQPSGYEDFGRVRVPGTGEQEVAVPGAFPTASSDNLTGIDIDAALIKVNFQECGPRSGAGTCTTVDSRPVKYFSGDSRGTIYYPCQGTMQRLDGATASGRCVLAGGILGTGYSDGIAKTRTITGGVCHSWRLSAGELIDAGMTANFVHVAPDSRIQYVFRISELFLNVRRSGHGVDTWQIRDHVTDSDPEQWSYFIGVDTLNARRYVKMYLSGDASSTSPTAVCANGDHIADLVLDVVGVGLIFTSPAT